MMNNVSLARILILASHDVSLDHDTAVAVDIDVIEVCFLIPITIQMAFVDRGYLVSVNWSETQ